MTTRQIGLKWACRYKVSCRACGGRTLFTFNALNRSELPPPRRPSGSSQAPSGRHRGDNSKAGDRGASPK